MGATLETSPGTTVGVGEKGRNPGCRCGALWKRGGRCKSEVKGTVGCQTSGRGLKRRRKH